MCFEGHWFHSSPTERVGGWGGGCVSKTLSSYSGALDPLCCAAQTARAEQLSGQERRRGRKKGRRRGLTGGPPDKGGRLHELHEDTRGLLPLPLSAVTPAEARWLWSVCGSFPTEEQLEVQFWKLEFQEPHGAEPRPRRRLPTAVRTRLPHRRTSGSDLPAQSHALPKNTRLRCMKTCSFWDFLCNFCQ